MKPRTAALAIAWLALSACEPTGEAPEPVTPVSRDVAADLYQRHCAICHGESGDGHGPRRGSLFRKPPDFRDPSWRADQTVSGVRRAIREGVPGSDMPSWKRLSAAEIAGLARYVLSLGGGAS